MAKWVRMWEGQNNQEVGLEAAILKRKRNSSLVKRPWADNVTGLKHSTEAVDWRTLRGALLVEERSLGREVRPKGLVERREVTLPA